MDATAILIITIIVIIAATAAASAVVRHYHDGGSSAIPRVHWYGDKGPLIVIIAGQHGNEPAPSEFLRRMVATPGGVEGAQVAVVPYANIRACRQGARGAPDMNRSWPDGTRVARYLAPLIAAADLVIDIHEASQRYPDGLGQTMYTNAPDAFGPVIDTAVAAVNKTVPNELAFRQITHVPSLGGRALDEFCTSVGTACVLIEILGQNDIVPVETRIQETGTILFSMLGGSWNTDPATKNLDPISTLK